MAELPTDITFEALLTASGALVAGGIVTGVVELIKMVFGQDINGALAAFILSAILYALAGIAVGVGTLNAGLNVFLAWLACATAAVGIHATQRTIRANT